MGIVKKNVLGDISGTVGDKVYKVRNGKQVVSRKPESVKISQSPKAKANMNKFGLTVVLASFVNAVPELKEVWTAAKVKGSNSYQKLISNNAKLTGEGRLTIDNIITPPGVPAKIEKAALDRESLSLTFMIINGRQESLPVPFYIHAVVYFFEPEEEDEDEFILRYYSRKIEKLDDTGRCSINISFGNDEDLFGVYKRLIIYAAAAGVDMRTGRIVWSSTSPAGL